MVNLEPALPSLGEIQAALHETTERLARELADPSGEAPDWSESWWKIACATACLHGISPLLAQTLCWDGPVFWRPFLDEQRAHTRMRYSRIRDLLRLLDVAAIEQGVAFVALKGAALHEMGLYEPGLRPMADLDLLASEQDVPRMAQIICQSGFRRTAVTWKHQVFEPVVSHSPVLFGEHVDNSLKIDLHSRIREILPLRPIDIHGLVLPTQPHPGLNSYRSQISLMIHLLLHAAGAMLLRTLRFVQLHDIALLSARMSADDWVETLERGATDRGPWWLLPPLAMTARYYDCVPQWVLSAAGRACNWSLRRSVRRRLVSDVSFSDMRRRAFPGISWTQSLGESYEYVLERALLSSRVLIQRMAAGVDGCAPSPSHGCGQQRVRWLGLRPVRPATEHAVRAAMLHSH